MQDTRTLVSDFPVMWTCLLSRFHRPSPRRSSAISLELMIHLVCFLMNSTFSFDPRASTINAMHSRVADKGLNFRHFPARGIFGMFMNEVLLHFHLQLVSLNTSSDLWPTPLRFQFADFLRFHTRVQQGIEVTARRTSRKKFGLFSILHSEFCSVIFKAEVRNCSVGSCSCQSHCKPFTESQPRCT